MKKNLYELIVMVFLMNSVSTTCAFSKEDYLKGKNYSLKVDLINQNARFIFCETTKQCRVLGVKDSYTKEDLERIKERERMSLYKKSAVATGIVAVGAGVMYITGVAGIVGVLFETAVAGSIGGNIAVQSIGAISTMLAPGVLLSLSNDVNPYTQFKKSNVFSNKLMSANEFAANDKSIKEAALILDEILY